MSYPASTKTLQKWVQDVDQAALALKLVAQQQKDASTAGTLSMEAVARFFNQLVSANVLFVAASSVTGIAAYLTNEKQGQSPDPVADFTAMQNQIVATLDWLRTNVPGAVFSGQTYKLAYLFPAGNTTQSSFLIFSAAVTAGYRTTLDALMATIG